MNKNSANAERAVLVTTVHKGVFFGYSSETGGETIRLRAGRLTETSDTRAVAAIPCPKCGAAKGEQCRIPYQLPEPYCCRERLRTNERGGLGIVRKERTDEN